jgi:hypothetical protein
MADEGGRTGQSIQRPSDNPAAAAGRGAAISKSTEDGYQGGDEIHPDTGEAAGVFTGGRDEPRSQDPARTV